MGFKKLLNKRTIVWGSVSLFLAGVLIAGNIVCRYEIPDLMYNALGRRRPIVEETEDTIDFGQVFLTKEEARKNGDAVTQKICEEGMILLKNNNNALPLKKGAKISVFGKNSVNLIYGGVGSAKPAGGERKTIFESLTEAGFEYNTKLEEFYSSSKSGDGRTKDDELQMTDEDSDFAIWKTGETPISAYGDDVKASYDQYNDAALVVFSRIAGESNDLPRKAADNENRTYLDLDNNERDLLKHIVDSGKFKHIVVLLNGSNYIDLGFLKDGSTDPVNGSKIDACINIGAPGANGIMALGRILNGDVNPSGKTVDLVYTNYKNDPTYQNFGGNFDATMDYYYAPSGDKTNYHVVEYEESIYFGYRYYETRGKDDEAWYQQNVVYPFGYGLSYTTFTEEIVNKAELEAAALNASDKFIVKVKVTNTGNVEGKQVVQVYAQAPYTNGKIEKPYKVLAGFAKTGLLGKNDSETVEIEINPYYFASFDNHDANGDGFKGYTLDAGRYTFHVATDSHTTVDTFNKDLAETANIENDPVTGTKVEPLFDDVSNGMKSNMSRTDWQGTFPTTASVADRTINSALNKALKSTESGNNDDYSNDEMPTMGAEPEDGYIRLRKLVGLKYDDEMWDKFLDQLTFEDLLLLFNKGCYSTCSIEKEENGAKTVIIPETTSCDGPVGLVNFMGSDTTSVYGTCYYCSECLVAQTYNLELAKEQAEAIGEEALIGSEETTIAYSGWYAPGVNLHRSPFSGRNSEYYSEDPFLCGKFAATVIDNVQKKGVYVNVKHFVLNDQETNRSAEGIATWCDEQGMRELYLRSFEIAVKEGGARGLMTSFNRVGTRWAGGDYRLCTTVLRKEWGFVGSVICDFHTSANAYMDSKQMLYAGGDINLTGQKQVYLAEGTGANQVSRDNVKDVKLLRNAAHNLLYCIANSNAMKANVVGYENAVWENVFTAATIGISVGIVGWGAWAIISSLLKKEEAAAVTETVAE